MRGQRGGGPSMRQIPGNARSRKLPGGSLLAAVLDRQLMIWSDRGGASRYFGERWSAQCAAALARLVGHELPVPAGEPYRLRAVVRLDDDPRVAIQAGRHKLVNPDFVLLGGRPDGSPVLQAADAKFAADTIKPAQVSADALRALLAVEGGLVKRAIEERIATVIPEPVSVERGLFLSPEGPLTDFYLPRMIAGPRATVDRREVILLTADPVAMFAGLPMTPLIGPLARIDRLPVSPRENLLAAMYYFRLACGCAWMWQEARAPLLSLNGAPEVDTADLLAEVTDRISGVESAIDLLYAWSREVDRMTNARKAISEVAAVPVRMRELRELAEATRRADDRRLVRQVRGTLERRYRARLIEEIGEIPAGDRRELTEILQQIASMTRKMRPEFRSLAEELINAGPAE